MAAESSLLHTFVLQFIRHMSKMFMRKLQIILEPYSEQAAEKGFDAGRLIGEHNFKIDAKDDLEAGGWEYITQKIADSVFQALEAEKSTLKLLEKVAKKLGLGVDKALITAALPYLEIRHLLVHADGKASDEYKQKYPTIRLKNDRVFINYVFLTRMRTAVKAMMEDFDKNVIAKDIVDAKYTQPQKL